jgi:hypothetical protein
MFFLCCAEVTDFHWRAEHLFRIIKYAPFGGAARVAAEHEVYASGSILMWETDEPVPTRDFSIAQEIHGGWRVDLRAVEKTLEILPGTFSAEAFNRLGEIASAVPQVITFSGRLTNALGLARETTIVGMERAVAIGSLVGTAPDASPEAFAADLWEEGVERAADLAEAVATLETSRKVSRNLVRRLGRST